METVGILLLSIFVLSSCSKFKSSRKFDVSPFADNTTTMFSEATKISQPFQWKYCKPYTSIPEAQQFSAEAIPLLEALHGIVYYSNQVVAINDAKLSDKEKNNQLARYLHQAMLRALEDRKEDSLQLNLSGAVKVLENIRNAESYREGILASEPIVNSVVRAIVDRIDRIQNQMIPLVLAGFDREIERDYGEVRRNYVRLQELQKDLMLSVTRLYRARMGDKAEIDTLLYADASMRNFIPSVEAVSPSQMTAAEKHLVEQLNEIDTMLHQLDGIKIEYIAKKDELIQWRSQVDDKIRVARTSIIIWAQSHRNLGAGIPVPPLFDVGGVASGLVGSAAKTVVP
ncbi:MAG: hypothetical protein ACK2TU_12565 [Anaerolineales bacterium]